MSVSDTAPVFLHILEGNEWLLRNSLSLQFLMLGQCSLNGSVILLYLILLYLPITLPDV